MSHDPLLSPLPSHGGGHVSISKRIRFQVFERDGFRCQYCGQAAPDVALEVDHKTPRCAGGSDDMKNLTSACYACNRGKAGSLLRTAYTLSEGPEGLGPMDGQAIVSFEQYPVLWVYRYPDNGEVVTFADSWQASVLDGELGVHRLTLGHPYRREGAFGPGGWHSRVPYPELLGFYIPSDTVSGCLYFITPGDMLTFLDLTGEQA